MKKNVFLVFFCFGILTANAQLLHPSTPSEEPKSKVHWLNFKEAFDLNKKQARPFLIDVYTDWCGWCKRMMGTTYSNDALAEYINTYFYPIKFNAETKDSIYFKDTLFVNKGSGSRPIHELSYKLMGNQQSYPTTIFMFDDLKNQANVPGYLDEKTMEPILIFFVENVYKNCPYQEFNKYFNAAFLDTAKLNKKIPLKKYSFSEAEKSYHQQKKKWLINLNTDWCNACKVMNRAVFTDTSIVKYINEKFYFIDFNVQTKDSILFFGNKFKYTENMGMPVNALALALSGNQLVLPTTIILDEDRKRLDALPRFYSPETLNPVLHFYGNDAFKKTQWMEFRNNWFQSKK